MCDVNEVSFIKEEEILDGDDDVERDAIKCRTIK